MDLGNYKLVGILGGMGPEATVSFFDRIVSKTPAKRDQDHIPLLIFNYPQIPDRTQSILSGESVVRDYLKNGIAFLNSSKVEVIAIPCVSSHYYYNDLKAASIAKLLSIIEETVLRIRAMGNVKSVGVLGTSLTVRKRLFHDALERNGFVTVTPAEELQDNSVMRAIYLVKAGEKEKASQAIRPAVENIVDKGVQVIIAGCTELPLILGRNNCPLPIVDTLDCLAEAVLREASKKLIHA